MKDEDKKWLIDHFSKVRNRTIRGEVYSDFLKAEMLLLGRDKTNPRGCSCNYRSLGESVNKLYTKWLSDNEEIF